MLVDDNPLMRRALTVALSQFRDLDLLPVEDGERALEDIRRRKPDVILTDISMPRIDGYGLLQALRGSHETAHIRVVAITVNGEDEDVKRGVDAGFDAYLTKPVDSGTLALVVAEQLRSVAVHGSDRQPSTSAPDCF